MGGKSKSKASSAQTNFNLQGIAAPTNAGNGAQGNLGITTAGTSGSKNHITSITNNAGVDQLTPTVNLAIDTVRESNQLNVHALNSLLATSERTLNTAITSSERTTRRAMVTANNAAKDSFNAASKITNDSLNAYAKVNADSLSLAESLAVKGVQGVTDASNKAFAFADTVSRSDEAKFSGELVKYGSLMLVGVAIAGAWAVTQK